MSARSHSHQRHRRRTANRTAPLHPHRATTTATTGTSGPSRFLHPRRTRPPASTPVTARTEFPHAPGAAPSIHCPNPSWAKLPPSAKGRRHRGSRHTPPHKPTPGHRPQHWEYAHHTPHPQSDDAHPGRRLPGLGHLPPDTMETAHRRNRGAHRRLTGHRGHHDHGPAPPGTAPLPGPMTPVQDPTAHNRQDAG